MTMMAITVGVVVGVVVAAGVASDDREGVAGDVLLVADDALDAFDDVADVVGVVVVVVVGEAAVASNLALARLLVLTVSREMVHEVGFPRKKRKQSNVSTWN